jgi:transaldolase
MKIFVDSAEIKELEAAASTGLVDGVTTNPSLVAKTGLKFEDLLIRICELIDGPVSAEVTATDAPGMIEQGLKLTKLHKNIVIKVPLTWAGLKATKAFTAQKIDTNVTLCFTPLQAMFAAKAGATYVSPFVGRIDDIGYDGMNIIQDIRTIFDNYNMTTQILVASIRHVEHTLTAAKMGADVSTIPYNVFTKLINNPLTDKGLEQFLKDWDR